MRTSLVLLGGGAVLLLGGCPLLDLEVETPAVRLHHGGVKVAGSDGGGAADLSFVLEHDDTFDALAGRDTSITFLRVDVTATSGPTELGFLTSARASAAGGDPDAGPAAQTIVACDGDACAHDGPTLSIPAGASIDAQPYLEADSVLVTIDVAGALPTADWTADVDVWVGGSASYAPQI